jgi:hypothetical protein
VDDRYLVQEPTLQGETIESAGRKHLASWIPEIHGLRVAIFLLTYDLVDSTLAIEYVTLLFRDSTVVDFADGPAPCHKHELQHLCATGS